MKRTLQITLLQFKILFRNFKSEGIIFILPIAFMSIFGLVFSTGGDSPSYKIGLIDNESEAYTIVKDQILSQLKNQDEEETSLFIITEFSNYDDAYQALEDENITAIIEIPENFYPQNYEDPAVLYGKPTDASFGAVSAIVRSSLAEYIQGKQDYLEVKSTNVDTATEGNAFNYIAPGMMIFGILILLPSISDRMVKINEKHYIFRYFTSKTNSFEIIVGHSLYQIVVAVVQIFILYYTAVLFGFSAKGNILYGLVIGIPTAFFVIGLGLLIGSMTKRSESANNIATLISILLGFLSGSFIAGIGQVLEFEVMGRIYQFNDFLPSKWATVAFEKVLRDGYGLNYVVNELLIILLSGGIVLILGVIVFYQRQLKQLE